MRNSKADHVVSLAADGLRGPILLKWCQQLLAERDELVARLRVLDTAKRTQEQLKQP